MRMTFDLDGGLSVVISSNAPRHSNDHNSVHIQVNRAESEEAPTGELLTAFSIKPSHARAISSALMTAATEGR